ncbi:MAG: radical family heme chaperone HemW [Bacteroidota bacterium]
MIAALTHELELKAPTFLEPIETIYFGGGTPSLLQTSELSTLLNTIYAQFDVIASPEITLEANPDDIHLEKAVEWKRAGINRLSIGIQSFDSHILQWMNRAHTAEQALKCIDCIREAGFDNFSIDLIYGSPQQSLKAWEKDLSLVFKLRIPHISCYALTLEEKTALHHMVKSGTRENVNPDHQADCFSLLLKQMHAHGYLHYEISNFCIPNHESKHNKSYWEGKPYLGIGPSAHSYQKNTRCWNVSNNIQYIKSIEEDTIPQECEMLTAEQQWNEYIMTSLRTAEGINKKRISDQWGDKACIALNEEIKRFVQTGKMIETEQSWKLSEEGKFLADGIAAEFFKI